MFSGLKRHKIDPRGRLTIPKKFRDTLGKEAIVVLSSEGFIRVYTKIERQNINCACTWIVELDKQGRILLPKQLEIHPQAMIWHGCEKYIELRPL